jgi:hypothetical protein
VTELFRKLNLLGGNAFQVPKCEIFDLPCQCCGSGLDSDPGGQNDPQKYKKVNNFMFWSDGYSILRTDGFSGSSDLFYGSLETSESQFLIKKYIPFCCIFHKFVVIKTLDPNSREMLDQDPDSMNPDLQHRMLRKFLRMPTA